MFAAVDALILQPQVHRSQKPVPELQISYGTKNDIKGSTRYTKDLSSLASLEAHGIVG